MSEDFAVVPGLLGDLFWKIAQPVLVFRSGSAIAVNPVAARLMSIEPTGGGQPLPPDLLRRLVGSAAGELERLVSEEGTALLDGADGCGRVFAASSWCLEGHDDVAVVLLRDVTEERRHLEGLETLNRLARELPAEASTAVVLQRVADVAKELTGAAFSAVILLRTGSTSEIQHFVYNAPRDRFPLRLPRLVGLLAVPIDTGEVARLDDIREHPAGVGIPVQHPPIAALLAVPVSDGSTVLGELAVANEPGQRPFDDLDQILLGELAAQTAIAVSLAASRALQVEAAQAQRALTDVALHNIRTPITVAMGFLEVLQGQGTELTEEERTASFDALSRALARIRDLSNDALLAAPSASSEQAEPDDVDPVAVVDDLVAELAPVSETVRIERLSEVPPGFTFPGQAKVIHDLIENLVTNAVKHSPDGESVTITVRVEGRSVRFDVSDRGPGVSATDQDRIFEQFYRTDDSQESGVQGTGLGLWIVKRLVTSCGGTVGVTSSPGQGSTFWLTFPRWGQKPVEPVTESGHG